MADAASSVFRLQFILALNGVNPAPGQQEYKHRGA